MDTFYNNFNMLIWWSKNISLLSALKNFFLEFVIIELFDEKKVQKKNIYLISRHFFCN